MFENNHSLLYVKEENLNDDSNAVDANYALCDAFWVNEACVNTSVWLIKYEQLVWIFQKLSMCLHFLFDEQIYNCILSNQRQYNNE